MLGLARFVMRVPRATSLKDKRAVLRRVRDRVLARHDLSFAEVGAQDEHGRAILALAMVSSDARSLRSALDGILREIEAMHLAPIVEERVEITSYGDSLSEPLLESPDRW